MLILNAQHSSFLCIVVAANTHYLYFVQKQYACGATGFSVIHKCIVAIRMLTYGMAIDAVDEYVRIGESTVESTMKCFCWKIKEVFKPTFDNPLHHKFSILQLSNKNCAKFVHF